MYKYLNYSPSEIIEQIEKIYIIFRNSRAYFPYIRDTDIGNYSPQPFTIVNNIQMRISFNEMITKEFQSHSNSISHFLNQNFLVRLFSILQYYEIYNDLDSKYKKLHILKRLRNKFGHSLGTYNHKSQRDRKLLKDIIMEFNLPQKDYSDFPISIDTVINEIIKESKKCIEELFKKPLPKITFLYKFVYSPVKSFFNCIKVNYVRFK